MNNSLKPYSFKSFVIDIMHTLGVQRKVNKPKESAFDLMIRRIKETDMRIPSDICTDNHLDIIRERLDDIYNYRFTGEFAKLSLIDPIKAHHLAYEMEILEEKLRSFSC